MNRTDWQDHANASTIDAATALQKANHSEETLECIKEFSEKYKTEVFHDSCADSCDEAVSPLMWVIFVGFQVGEDDVFEVAHKVFFIKLHCQREDMPPNSLVVT